MKALTLYLRFTVFLFLCTQAHGQGSRLDLRQSASHASDIILPAKEASLSFFSRPTLALYKPSGTGPFPALVLVHQCGGLQSAASNWQNLSVLFWARAAVDRGHVVLVLDSLGPRGIDEVCLGPKGGLNWPRGVKDALLAATHLQSLDYVDRQRVFLLGFSWGGSVGLLASSKQWVDALSDTAGRFTAVAALYPRCHGAATLSDTFIASDIDRPLLVITAELDTETPSSECIGRLEAARQQGAPVRWHTYGQATHCWDCRNLDGYSKTVFGRAVSYRYSHEATHDSVARVFSFFSEVAPR
jgi:dienelactone hydrolase